jgi:16S rRNA (guanine1207-N2)-methyltransferase
LGADVNTMKNVGAVAERTGVYGVPPAEVLELPVKAIQFSPLIPGASALELQGDGTLTSMTMLAPPGTLERRYAMA